MNNLHSLFPHGSNAFFNANSKAQNHLQPAEPQPHPAMALGKAVPREKESLGRATLCFRGFFVRLKDPDNFAGSLKNCIDAVRRCGLVDDDSPDKIKLICEQEKVEHFASERIELTIKYP
jgi:hypothetical protein